MSAAPAPGPRDPKPDPSAPSNDSPKQDPKQGLKQDPKQDPKPKPKAALVFDDPLDQQSSDDTDRGWGERAPSGSSAADLSRFLDEKPPHHV
ncbi:hypothetical protein [Streptomyces sp. NPDC058382]|uniref:hypothetical protein n=1 Tax=unclassified Streptomyces TaxID=2593676 RepID=UPI003633C829